MKGFVLEFVSDKLARFLGFTYYLRGTISRNIF